MNVKLTALSVLSRCCFIVFLLYAGNNTQAQIAGGLSYAPPKTTTAMPRFVAGQDGDLFGTAACFIQNIGQYGEKVPGHSGSGNILYGYEGFDMPVLFTKRGLVYLQRKAKSLSRKEEKEREHQGKAEKEEEEMVTYIDKAITMEWVNANPNPQVVEKESVDHYFTYGQLHGQAKGYKKIIYKDLYPGIDLVYSFLSNKKRGYEYSFIVKPGADVSKVKMRYGGDVKSLKKDAKGNLVMQSRIGSFTATSPEAFYADAKGDKIKIAFSIKGKEVSFGLEKEYDKSKRIIIDPFVTVTDNLFDVGLNTLYNNNGIATDVDYDYRGNAYVSGGGFVPVFQFAKYNSSGSLLWTFSGKLSDPYWKFSAYPGWTVDKLNGKSYLGQALTDSGARIIRLNADGEYDNYISTADLSLWDANKMIWEYNNGTPQILIGGSSKSFRALGILPTSSTTIQLKEVTDIYGHPETIGDLVTDTTSHEIYCVNVAYYTYEHEIIRFNQPYNRTTKAWAVPLGLKTLSFLRNRPYLDDPLGSSSSLNSLALNSCFLFFWDGKNLKALNRATGADVGSLLTIEKDTALYQGGIIADECNNIYVGSTNGTIKVYKFTGTTFNDDAAPDIIIPGFATKSTYDLAYDNARKLLYASGAGFVAAFDVSSYCAASTYSVNVTTDCSKLSATAVVTPSPPAGTLINYNLYKGETQISSNSTGIFTALNASTPYTVKAIINEACSGLQTTADFSISGPAIAITKTDACTNNGGTITVTGSGGQAPYTYSINGTNFQTGNSFTNVAAGTYTVVIKDASGCTNTATATIAKSASCLSAAAAVVQASCGKNNGIITITAANGTAPYTYSLDSTTFQSSPVFKNLSSKTYIVIVKDATGATSTISVPIENTSGAQVTTSATQASCSKADGSITATATGGVAPLQYSIDGTLFQNTGNFVNVTAGNYTVIVKDATGCATLQPIIVPVQNNLTVDAGADQTICEGKSATLTATSNGDSYLWTPATAVVTATTSQTTVSPSATTTYYVQAKAGSCNKSDSVTVFVNPSPIAHAGEDVTICYGQNATLQGSGGVQFLWAPQSYLDDIHKSTSTSVKPQSSINYYLSVVDSRGCASVHADTVRVIVTPPVKVFAGNDMSTLINQPVQLQAVDLSNNSIVRYTWSPGMGLNNAYIPNPVATLSQDMEYRVTVQTGAGCEGSDAVKIKVYTGAEIYVPSAFTPNGDGRNDKLKAIPVGIRNLTYFKAFNRWGEIVFATSNASEGWDGRINNQLLGTGVFTWIAKGVDLKGNVIERKGTVTLIR